MARENIDTEPIPNTLEGIRDYLARVRADFDSHNHDGANSPRFQTMKAETLTARAIAIRKTSYGDSTAGLWEGLVDSTMKMNLGNASSYIKWDGTTLTIAATLTATSINIGTNGFHVDVNGNMWWGSSSTYAGATYRISSAGAANLSGLTVGTNVGVGSGSAYSGVINAAYVNALSVVAGSVSADNVTAGTITGSTIRTASSGQRVQMSASTNTLDIYDASRLRMQLGGQGTTFYDTSGNNVADIYAGTTGGLLITTANSGSTSRSIYVAGGTNGVASLGIATTNYIYANGPTAEIYVAKSIQPVTGGLDLGGNPYSFSVVNLHQASFDEGTMTLCAWGYVSGTSITRSNVSWSVTNPSTGNYTVTHNLGSSTYAVQLTALRASGSGAYVAKVASVSTNSFAVIVFDDGGVARDSDFFFLVTEA